MSTAQSQPPELRLWLSWGAFPTVDVEAKLRRLMAINYNNRNWSWLLDPNRPPESPVILKVSTLSKILFAFDPEVPAQEVMLLTID